MKGTEQEGHIKISENFNMSLKVSTSIYAHET